MKPIIVSDNDTEGLERLRVENQIWKERDLFDSQVGELYEISFSSQGKEEFLKSKRGTGSWVYYPWSGEMLHIVSNSDLQTIRTNRNRNLVTTEEQEVLQGFTVGVVGLSVGNNVATGLVFQGISKAIKLADFDKLETTNLNRVRAPLARIGTEKVELTAQQIYEVNPYAEVVTYPEGLTEGSLESFLNSDPKPKLVFEIIDNFKMKIKLRLRARELGIPVIMMANLGDSILVDTERYDLNKDLSLFNGILGDFPERALESSEEDVNRLAVEIVGKENVPERAIQSVGEIGKTLVNRPQLSSTVTISGGVGVYIARNIALGKEVKSGRSVIKFSQAFGIGEDYL